MLNCKIENEFVDKLFEAILLLENKDECYKFFEDLCTIHEMQALAQRLEVVKMLKQNKKYIEITKKTGASTATISRVSRSLNYGKDGYNIILERLDKER